MTPLLALLIAGLLGFTLATGAEGAGQSNGPREITVAADGSGTYKSVQEAIAAAPTGTREHPSLIRVRPGTYREILYVQREKRYLRLVGDDPATTIVTYDLYAGMPGLDGKPIGTFRTPTATIDGDDVTIENLSMVNSAGPKGQALAVRVDGDRIVFRNCRFSGWQDTLFDNRGRHFYSGCTITGATDFIFGGGTGFFEGCRIVCAGNGYVTAGSTPQEQPYGFVFSNCSVVGATPEIRSTLGRPWRDYAQTAWLNCDLGAVIKPEGWSNWNGRDKTARYSEYRCFGPGAITKERVLWEKKLTAAEGDAMGSPERVLAGNDGWNPRAGYVGGAVVTPDLAYGEAGGERLLLDVSSPEAGDGPYPIVILIHGGGWGSGDKQGDMAPLLGPLLAQHFTWFTINYRLAPKHLWPDCQEDVATAIRWVKAHAAKYKGDPNRIALVGYSAGGQLACRAAVDTTPETHVQAIVGLAAPTDIPADVARRGGLSKSLLDLFGTPSTVVDTAAQAKMREMSAIDHLPPDRTPPPCLLVHGSSDKSVPYDQSIAFQKKLKAANASCDLIPLPDAPHAIAQWSHYDPLWRTKVADWLQGKLASKATTIPAIRP